MRYGRYERHGTGMYRRNPRSGHTPGPWEVSKHGTPSYAPQFGIYAEGEQNDLAIVKGENAEADAILMAAAPDLLGVLKEAEEIIFGPIADLITGDQMAETGAYDVLDTIRKAIAKAEGRR